MRFIERFCRVDYDSDQDFREHFFHYGAAAV